jgi:uncharacterized protein (DUF885 family)
MKRLAFAINLAFAAAPALAADSLESVIKDHWAWSLAQSPTFATSVGVRDYDDRLQDSSLAAYETAVEDQRRFLARLEAPTASITTS